MCPDGSLLPGDQARVPANLAAIRWRRQAAWDSPLVTSGDVRLVQVGDGGEQSVPFALDLTGGFELLIRPTEPLLPGATYRVEGNAACAISGQRVPVIATLAVGDVAPLPASLGRLRIEPLGVAPLVVAADARDGCYAQIQAAQARIVLELAPQAQPWSDALLYQTLVSGTVWSPAESRPPPPRPLGWSWVGRGVDLLYAKCSGPTAAEPGLSSRSHDVWMTATIPGTLHVVQSEVVAVDLKCPAVPVHELIDGGTSPLRPSGGCQSHRGRNPGTWLLAIVVALALALFSRRTRWP